MKLIQSGNPGDELHALYSILSSLPSKYLYTYLFLFVNYFSREDWQDWTGFSKCSIIDPQVSEINKLFEKKSVGEHWRSRRQEWYKFHLTGLSSENWMFFKHQFNIVGPYHLSNSDRKRFKWMWQIIPIHKLIWTQVIRRKCNT